MEQNAITGSVCFICGETIKLVLAMEEWWRTVRERAEAVKFQLGPRGNSFSL